MYKIDIQLPADRRFCGSLTVYSLTGDAILGPVAVAGKAGNQLARANFNPNRTPLLPYGDTPCGTYRFSRVISMRNAGPSDVARYGRFGIAVFDACTGDAALAEAAGRFELWIHGGSFTHDCLSSTAGSLRLSDDDQRQLMRLPGTAGSATCLISNNPAFPNGAYGQASEDTRSDYFDPPSLHANQSRAGCGGVLLASLAYALTNRACCIWANMILVNTSAL